MPASHNVNRTHPRCAVELNYRMEVGNDVFDGITANISIGGAFLTSGDGIIHEKKPTGEGILSLSCFSKTVDIKIKIVYSGVHGMGVQFLDMTPEIEDVLNKVIEDVSHS